MSVVNDRHTQTGTEIYDIYRSLDLYPYLRAFSNPSVPFKHGSNPRFAKRMKTNKWYCKHHHWEVNNKDFSLLENGNLFPFSLALNDLTYFDVVSSSIELHQNALINEICQRAIFWRAKLIFICGYLLHRATTRVVLNEILHSSVFHVWDNMVLHKKKKFIQVQGFFVILLIWKCQRILWILICMKAIIYNWWI